MTTPTATDIFATLEATWPPASRAQVGHWTIRDGQGGGRRVSATTGNATTDIKSAETAMADLNQPALFMIRNGDAALDRALARRGYQIDAPTSLLCCPIETLTRQSVPKMTAFIIWPPLAILRELWAEGGVGPARQAVMDRVTGPRTCLLGRTENRPSAAAFVAVRRNTAMLHALEVTPSLRRNGTGINIMRLAAQWAQDQGARYFSVAVTDANFAANGLYSKLGLTVVGHYHYRTKHKQ